MSNVDVEALRALIRAADPRNSESLIQLLAATVHDVPALLDELTRLRAFREAAMDLLQEWRDAANDNVTPMRTAAAFDSCADDLSRLVPVDTEREN